MWLKVLDSPGSLKTSFFFSVTKGITLSTRGIWFPEQMLDVQDILCCPAFVALSNSSALQSHEGLLSCNEWVVQFIKCDSLPLIWLNQIVLYFLWQHKVQDGLVVLWRPMSQSPPVICPPILTLGLLSFHSSSHGYKTETPGPAGIPAPGWRKSRSQQSISFRGFCLFLFERGWHLQRFLPKSVGQNYLMTLFPTSAPPAHAREAVRLSFFQ